VMMVSDPQRRLCHMYVPHLRAIRCGQAPGRAIVAIASHTLGHCQQDCPSDARSARRTHDPHFECQRSLLRESICGIGVSTRFEVRDKKHTFVHAAQHPWQVMYPRSLTTGLSSSLPPLNCANAYDSLCSFAPEDV
jgi:hypothetical protein